MASPAHLPTLLAALGQPSRRREAARELGHAHGAGDLIVFIGNPGYGALLPAPGFPQTLHDARMAHVSGSAWVSHNFFRA